MRVVRLALCGLFFASSAFAQDTVLKDAATRYVQHPVQQKMLDDLMSPQAMLAQLQPMLPDARQETLEAVAQIVSEEMALLRPAMEQAMIISAAETFTLAELDALRAFYATKEGAGAAGKMQNYLARSWEEIGPEFNRTQLSVQQRMSQVLSQN
jgi:hypothetical protein